MKAQHINVLCIGDADETGILDAFKIEKRPSGLWSVEYIVDTQVSPLG